MRVSVLPPVLVHVEPGRGYAGAEHTGGRLRRSPRTARLPSARVKSSSGRPTSKSAPSTMSPEIPEKQSKDRSRDIYYFLMGAPPPFADAFAATRMAVAGGHGRRRFLLFRGAELSTAAGGPPPAALAFAFARARAQGCHSLMPFPQRWRVAGGHGRRRSLLSRGARYSSLRLGSHPGCSRLLIRSGSGWAATRRYLAAIPEQGRRLTMVSATVSPSL